VVQETNYYPYGSVIYDAASRFLYTGKELDRSSGLMYYGARYYDAGLGQWIQPDPLISDLYNPQGLNRYAYVLNNPLKYVDPDGNSALAAAGIGALIGGTYSVIIQLPTGKIDLGRVGISAGAGAAGATFGFAAASYIPASSPIAAQIVKSGTAFLITQDVRTIGENIATGQHPAANTGSDNKIAKTINNILEGKSDFSEFFVEPGREVGPIVIDFEMGKVRGYLNEDKWKSEYSVGEVTTDPNGFYGYNQQGFNRVQNSNSNSIDRTNYDYWIDYYMQQGDYQKAEDIYTWSTS